MNGRTLAGIVALAMIAGGATRPATGQPAASPKPSPTPNPSPSPSPNPNPNPNPSPKPSPSPNPNPNPSPKPAALPAVERRADRLEIDDCGAPPVLAPERLRQLAGEHYDRGDVLYVQGDYAGAVSELVSSYCLLPHYRVLKDIGQAYERQLEYSRAIAYLKRYVAAVPDDAKAAACAPDPREDRRNVSARIEVLSSLPARIRVATEPPEAEITLTGEDGLTARGVSTEGGGLVLARAGRYEMVVRKPGFVPHQETIVAEIGKPYSYVFQLERERGRLLVQAVPGNARLFLDDRFVGIGRYEADLAGDTYTLLVEASDRVSERRRVEVRPKQTERVVVELPPRPQSGRTQLVWYSTLAGAVALNGSLAGSSDNVGAIAAASGLAIGGIAGYVGIPDDIRLGASSLTITGSIAGGAAAFFGTSAFSSSDNVTGPATALGIVAGGAAGYTVAQLASLSPGDAALINTGMVWGTVYGGLFSSVFDNPETIDVSLAAGGLGLGVLTSGLLVRSFPISRGHAALIDLGGVGGLVLSVGIRSLIDQQSGQDANASTERQAHFGLAGVTLGLAAAAFLTRNYDAASLPSLQPSLGRVKTSDGSSVMSYGLSARF